MTIQKHNPYCKLIGVTINKKQFVYAETNKGENIGLEVYYQEDDRDKGFYYSRRFVQPNIPMIYHELFIKLAKMVDKCPDGHKITLENSELPPFN